MAKKKVTNLVLHNNETTIFTKTIIWENTKDLEIII